MSGGAANERNFEAYLVADSSEHSSHELTKLLGMVPDERWDSGEHFSFNGRTKIRHFSRWALVERDDDIPDWRFTVERLLKRLEPIRSKIRGLPPTVRVALTMFVTESNDVFGFGLDSRQVELLSKIRAELDMSFVVRAAVPDASAPKR